MAKKGFILFHDYKEQFFSLSDYECGKLIKAIFEYATTGEALKLPPKASMAFGFIKNAIDENSKKYDEVLKARSEAGKKSGEVRRRKALDNNKMNISSICSTNRTITDTETKTETDTVTETETKTKTDTAVKSDVVTEALETAKRIIGERSTPAPSKTARGEFKNVFLSDDELSCLAKEYTEKTALEAVELLSTRIARDNRYANENHYATIKDWVITAVHEQQKKRTALSDKNDEKLQRAKKAGFDFDFDDIFEKPMG